MNLLLGILILLGVLIVMFFAFQFFFVVMGILVTVFLVLLGIYLVWRVFASLFGGKEKGGVDVKFWKGTVVQKDKKGKRKEVKEIDVVEVD